MAALNPVAREIVLGVPVEQALLRSASFRIKRRVPQREVSLSIVVQNRHLRALREKAVRPVAAQQLQLEVPRPLVIASWRIVHESSLMSAFSKAN